MKIIKNIKNKIFKKKLEKIGFDMKDEENNKISEAFNEAGLGGNHFIKCMEDGIRNKNLQDLCERISGRKEAGRFLQQKPLVMQCHSCQNDFSDEKGVTFAGEPTIYLESLEKMIKHFITCDGVICDCGKKVLYFDDCKDCKRKWDERSIALMSWNPEMRTKKQKEQIKEYKQKFVNATESEEDKR